MNDFFEIFAFGIEDVSLKIFNRWGALVYETNQLDKFWDGMHKGREVPSGVFVAKLDYVDQASQTFHVIVQDVTVIR